MRKLYATAIVIAACAALCAVVWPQNDVDGKVLADAKNGNLGAYMEVLPQPTQREICTFSDDTPVMPAAEFNVRETVAEKVGIMGGEDEAPTNNAQISSPELTEPTGEVIDQTINTRPEKDSTPPDNKLDTAPPDNGEINQQYAEQQTKTPSAGACSHRNTRIFGK